MLTSFLYAVVERDGVRGRSYEERAFESPRRAALYKAFEDRLNA